MPFSDSKHMQSAFGNFFVLATLETMLIFERATRLSALTFIEAHRFRFHLSNCSPQRGACHRSIQIKSNLKPNHMRPNHTHKTYIKSNPMRSKSTQISSNLNPKKTSTQNFKKQSKLKSQAQNQRKSIKINQNQIKANPPQSDPIHFQTQSPKSTSTSK